MTTKMASLLVMPKMQPLSLLVLCLVLSLANAKQPSPVYTTNGSSGPQIVEATPSPPLPKSLSPSTSPPRHPSSFVTKTVYGFLDFTTTVGSTVMIFTPQSQSAKLKSSKTVTVPQVTKALKVGRPSPRPVPSPTPTLPGVIATPAPKPQPSNTPVKPSATLESSFFSPHSSLAIEDLFSTPHADDLNDKPRGKSQTSKQPQRPGNFRHRSKESDLDSRRRLDLNFFNSRKKSGPRQPLVPAASNLGGSTLVPITVEGSGTLAHPHPSPVFLPTPTEVVVTATQGFASLSVIGPFSTAINNELGQVSQHYDYLSSAASLDVTENYDVYDVEATATVEDVFASDFPIASSSDEFPTGLVTKMGGTISSKGLITVHETSVIGTYIDGQYAQVLLSTSHIFHTSPTATPQLTPPMFSNYETVKSVIKGSATHIITPEATASLPIESLFSEPSARERDSRADEESEHIIQSRLRSALSKRRGAQQEPRPRVHDPYLDEQDEHDLQRSGSNLRPSFRLQAATSARRTPEARTSIRRQQEISTFYAQTVEPRTYRPRFKPTATRRTNGRPSSRRSPPGESKRPGRPGNRWRLGSSPRPKVNINRRPPAPLDVYEEDPRYDYGPTKPVIKPTPEAPILQDVGEETLQIVTSTLEGESTNVVLEMATIRSLHTFRVGTTKNTRYVTFTKTVTHHLETTPPPDTLEASTGDDVYQTQLFENILDDGPRDISTLPPVDLGADDITALLETVTETFSTTETMLKTSVLPVLHRGATQYHTLTQTYHITRVVTALKTMPPYEAFSFIPENSLNEFNGQLLAEGTENDEALLPGEVEYDENGEIVSYPSETRVPPPAGFPFTDTNLAQLAGGQFNPDVLEKQLHPQLAALLQQRLQQQQQQQQQRQQVSSIPQLIPGQLSSPASPTMATPGLSPEQMQQLAYLRLINPYSFGSFPQQQNPAMTVTSRPVTITTDITTTSTRVFKVIFNARPIMTTISTVETIHTTLTTYSTATITVAPTLPSFPLFGGSPFQLG